MSVGVVVPVRGPAPFLDAALAGLAAQTVPITRTIVVDDASSPPIERADVRLETPGRAAGARNAGLERLDTEWVGFCDADDVWAPDKLARQLEADADVCVGGVQVVDAAGRPTGERWPRLDTAPEALYLANPIVMSSVLVRRSVLAAAGGFDAAIHFVEDWDLWLRLAAAGHRFVAVPDAVVAYRRHAGSLTLDVAGLARAQLDLHRAHAGLVSDRVRSRALQADFLALQDGLIRERDWGGAREALGSAAAFGPVPRRARVRGAVARLPLLRSSLGRRSPYR